MGVDGAATMALARREHALTTWQFSDGNVPSRAVTLPHTNVQLPWHGFADAEFQFVSRYSTTVCEHFAADESVYVDFEAAMVAAVVYLNGVPVGQHRGGFTPFSVELTPLLSSDVEAELLVVLDSTELSDVPPFGGRLDYLTFGGIYREATLRIVNECHINDVCVRAIDVMDPSRRALEVAVSLLGPVVGMTVDVVLHDKEDRELASTRVRVDRAELSTRLDSLEEVELWSPETPVLYRVTVSLGGEQRLIDHVQVRTGFRELRFTERGFSINGKLRKLVGLNRHQTYPFVGAAMPARIQRRDAELIHRGFNCDIVRSSHYPPSKHFLDYCDEQGLLVIEEVPGWAHIGDDQWKSLLLRDLEAMIRRDRNRPSVVLWGVRVNESPDDHAFYSATNSLAHDLDPTRQTTGVRNRLNSEFLEDVFAFNDFRPDGRASAPHLPYLIAEHTGHTYPSSATDPAMHQQEHALRHARVVDQALGDSSVGAVIGWCAFDYATQSSSGAGDGICYHGVADIFRNVKPAAGFYSSQRDPSDGVVLEPAFAWVKADFYWQSTEPHARVAQAPLRGELSPAVFFSNCEELRLYVGEHWIDTLVPLREEFPNLSHPPFRTMRVAEHEGERWGDLRVEGLIAGKVVAKRMMSARGYDARFSVAADDDQIFADGVDMTRVAMVVTDEYGNIRRQATGAVALEIAGPGELVGENPFALVGGSGAIWIRSDREPGDIVVTMRHPTLGAASVTVRSAGRGEA